jgi:hypothetical protein
MTGRSPRNRRVPPRGNPDETEQKQQFHTGTPPLAAIPWKLLIITTGVTTITGYLFLEGIRALHGLVKRRSASIASSKNPEESQEQRPPGALPNGAFQLPLPHGAEQTDLVGPAHGGFAIPRLTDVTTPIGRLQHDQTQTDARLQRIENLLNGHYGDTG